MPSLHPQIEEVLRVMAEARLRPIEAMTPAEAREQMEATARARKRKPLLARDAGEPPLRLQSLVYPVADYTMSTPSYEKFATGCGILTRDAMAWFQQHYLRGPADALDWRASPIRAASLAGVAPAIVITA